MTAQAIAREAALDRADEREFGPTVDEGEDVCHVCGTVCDEGDLWHAGGDGDPTCTRCVMETDRDYREMRVLLVRAAAVLDIRSKTPTTQDIVSQARKLLGGWHAE